MDCYFRQSWIDRRLAYSHSSLSRLQVSVSTLERLWKPDTFFHNGKKSNLHTITVPNKFLRISPDGRILYSMRYTVQSLVGADTNYWSPREPASLTTSGFSLNVNIKVSKSNAALRNITAMWWKFLTKSSRIARPSNLISGSSNPIKRPKIAIEMSSPFDFAHDWCTTFSWSKWPPKLFSRSTH